ncbi:hypothetical protein BDV95DRAFT_606815 [Massariosphaeria phaeospora]|uniref:Zinc finger PHD-type domain-containing protein n=1 Tax=Massariosphaeria phaeospora TaxID=100035 RepID=A0A7C8I5K5_9PLEO|nr:hypothetical protein BDV95DRAFT_606815 [Massariosphaeria phaeospora]
MAPSHRVSSTPARSRATAQGNPSLSTDPGPPLKMPPAHVAFVWADGSLGHHCGICGKPLSNPNAKNTCIGRHEEPCHRYHQHLFMPGRGHTCDVCRKVDGAHYKRHQKIARTLGDMREKCGLLCRFAPTVNQPEGDADDRFIEDEAQDELREGEAEDQLREDEAQDKLGEDATGPLAEVVSKSDTPADPKTQSSLPQREKKRAKKERKRAEKADERPKILTGEDYEYVSAVLHTGELSTPEIDEKNDPKSLAEVEEIEIQLRYSASVRNDGTKRKENQDLLLRKGVDVDFRAEMLRIEEVFHINELVKQNVKNQSLKGKEAKLFDTLVSEFRKLVIEDLVLLQKELLEIRMRRFSYSRYVNWKSVELVDERYSTKEHSTGERKAEKSAKPEAIAGPADRPLAEVSSPLIVDDNPDQRHLYQPYKKLNTTRELEDVREEDVDTVRREPLPATTFRSFRISASNKENNTPPANATRPLPSSSRIPAGPNAIELPLGIDRDKDMDIPEHTSSPPSAGPSEHESDTPSHPIVSQKKAKKKRREDIRKEKRKAEKEAPSQPPHTKETAAISSEEQAMSDTVRAVSGIKVPHTNGVNHPGMKRSQEQSSATTMTPLSAQQGVAPVNLEAPPESPPLSVQQGVAPVNLEVPPEIRERTESTDPSIPEHAPSTFVPVPKLSITSVPSIPALAFVTDRASHHHINWEAKFQSELAVDALSTPTLTHSRHCFDDHSPCRHALLGAPDCPNHLPYAFNDDPLVDQCYLVFPSSEQLLFTGPYNRRQGEKLLTKFDQLESTRGRLMVLDDDMGLWLLAPAISVHDTPQRFKDEESEHRAHGSRTLGPLMKQRSDFLALLQVNDRRGNPLKEGYLVKTITMMFEPENAAKFCFCQEVLPQSPSSATLEANTVQCAHKNCPYGGIFHKKCVEKLRIEAVTTFFCSSCQRDLAGKARRFLQGTADGGESMRVLGILPRGPPSPSSTYPPPDPMETIRFQAVVIVYCRHGLSAGDHLEHVLLCREEESAESTYSSSDDEEDVSVESLGRLSRARDSVEIMHYHRDFERFVRRQQMGPLRRLWDWMMEDCCGGLRRKPRRY